MLSFIIIGMNEAKTIGLTIQSVLSYISYNKISEYEIIYVDSRSTDNSTEIVKEFNEVKIFEITGEKNAAIARNIGAKEAKGDVFIFLDADMEIEKEFHNEVFNENNTLRYPFVSGQLKNIFYNHKWKKIDESFHFPNLKEDTFSPTTGGYFIIDRKVWFSVDGMKTKYRRSQDLDLGLRLANKGTLLFRKKALFVVHHTIDYHDESRMWKMLFDKSLLYSSSVMIRDHFFNKYMYKRLLRSNYSFIVFVLAILGSFLNIFFIFLHPLLILFKIILLPRNISQVSRSELFVYYFLIDLFILYGLFFFHPKNIYIEYKEIS